MDLPTLDEIEAAAQLIYQQMTPSPQISWPLLNQRAGCDVWVKHENHNPTGAFKVRGGLIYVGRLADGAGAGNGICAATRGNHGQSLAYAAARMGLKATVVVPEGNSPDKNAAMIAYGAELIIHGEDFDAALEEARRLSLAHQWHFMPSIDGDLIPGVATYALEFFKAAPRLDRVYVPIGLGSGICGVIAVRNALGLATDIIGVVSSHANAYALSFDRGEVVATNTANTLADGLAVRNPSEEVLALMLDNVQRVVSVDDDSVMNAISHYFTDTHNVAEGAGAAPLAALLADRDAGLNPANMTAGVILTGGNINQQLFRRALQQASTTE